MPVVRLTAALQNLSRRPPVLALLRPGSLSDTMHMRAILATMLPQIEASTASLRAEIVRGRALQAAARQSASALRASQGELDSRRQSLAALETRQRLASRAASGSADREAERALALAEQARDLSGLVDDLGKAGAMREQLARLPGPLLRPERPSESLVVAVEAPAEQPSPLPEYQLPVDGRLTAGFGEAVQGSPKSRGVAIAPRAGAQAVAPSAGRVVFAGPYQGFGSIVIIDHGGGWTSLVTGLAQLDTRVGEVLVSGSPLGTAGAGRPVIGLELRQGGTPVNPLDLVSPR